MKKNVFITAIILLSQTSLAQFQTKEVAKSIPFDNSTNDFTATNVQTAIEEANQTAIQSASPGFTWGRSGNVISGTYLLNDSVPSNISGRIVPIASGQITTVFIAAENPDTFTIDIQKNTGGIFTTIAQATLSGTRTVTITLNAPPTVNQNDELAAKLSSGSGKNIVIGIVIRGSF